jgi:GTP-binding protein
MFVDELKMHMKAGNGGNGVVSWHHEKGKEMGGPDGGNGGKGGDVYIRVVRDIGILAKQRYEKEFAAENGGAGQGWSMQGKYGEDLDVKLPMGSIVKNLKTGEEYELLNDEDRILVLKGGRGGLGNEHFKSSKNTSPKEWTAGKEGEEADFHVELKLVADIGFVGLPNAGKSSLLNALTNAQAKIGSYQFTTLEPNLGEMQGFILADIPGLIEGASEGKGLGHKFLRHVTRTRTILHLVSLESEDVVRDYETIRIELKKHGEGLSDKKEILVLTKSDSIAPADLKKKVALMKKKNKDIHVVSILDDAGVKKLSDYLIKILRKI